MATTPDPKAPATPAVKVEVSTAPAPRTPLQDAKDALPARKAAEAEAKAAHQKLEDAGQLVEPGPIVGYEHARAQMGSVPDDATPSEPQAK